MRTVVIAPIVAAAVVAAAGWSSREAAPHDAAPWLVISSTRAGDEYTIGDGQPYSLRPDGSRLTTLLGHESPLDPIHVSPDGRLIAYGNGNTDAIYVSHADGSALRRLPASGSELRYLTFSPDGSTVAIVRSDDDEHPHLVVVDADGRNLRKLGRAGPPDWSPTASCWPSTRPRLRRHDGAVHVRAGKDPRAVRCARVLAGQRLARFRDGEPLCGGGDAVAGAARGARA